MLDSVRVRAVTVKPASSRACTTAGPRFPLPYDRQFCIRGGGEVGRTPITATFLIDDIVGEELVYRYRRILMASIKQADLGEYKKASISRQRGSEWRYRRVST